MRFLFVTSRICRWLPSPCSSRNTSCLKLGLGPISPTTGLAPARTAHMSRALFVTSRICRWLPSPCSSRNTSCLKLGLGPISPTTGLAPARTAHMSRALEKRLEACFKPFVFSIKNSTVTNRDCRGFLYWLFLRRWRATLRGSSIGFRCSPLIHEMKSCTEQFKTMSLAPIVQAIVGWFLRRWRATLRGSSIGFRCSPLIHEMKSCTEQFKTMSLAPIVQAIVGCIWRFARTLTLAIGTLPNVC